MIDETHIFPAKLFRVSIPNPQDILMEIKSKREQIKAISEAFDPKDNNVYMTDYRSPVKLESFEKSVGVVSGFFLERGLNLSIRNYWTAFYTKNARHNPHTHRMSIADRTNYSSVLNLSDFGETCFFPSNDSSWDKIAYVDGKFGQLVLFPATIIHAYFPQSLENNAERIIVSCNFNLESIDD